MAVETYWVCDGCGDRKRIAGDKTGDWHKVSVTLEGFVGYPTNAQTPVVQAHYHLCPGCTSKMYEGARPNVWPREAKHDPAE